MIENDLLNQEGTELNDSKETDTDDSYFPEIPSFQEHVESLKNQIPIFPPSDWEETLDAVAVCWQSGEKKFEIELGEFDKALALPNIPEEEKDIVSKYKQQYREKTYEFFTGIFEISANNKLKWSRMRELAEISKYLTDEDYRPRDEQGLAFLYAVSETHHEGRTKEEIRQKIAQHAFEEVFQLGMYRVASWTGADSYRDLKEYSTRDFFEQEKGELSSALSNPLWTEEKTEDMKKLYKIWRKVAKEGDNRLDLDDIELLKGFWDLANGKSLTKTNSLEVLRLGERVYKKFEDKGAFDIQLDLDDSEDEDEEEE